MYWSHKAVCLKSPNFNVPRLLPYINKLQLLGWNSDTVITSVNSSIFSGLISTMLKQLSGLSKFHKLILKSSVEMKHSPSLFGEILLIWYAWALAKILLGYADRTDPEVVIRGIRNEFDETVVPPLAWDIFNWETAFNLFSYIFQSLIVLSINIIYYIIFIPLVDNK